jgi:hypothetical protein
LSIVNGIDPQAQLLQGHFLVKLGILWIVIQPDLFKVELYLSLVVDCLFPHDADVGEEVGNTLDEVGLDLVVGLESSNVLHLSRGRCLLCRTCQGRGSMHTTWRIGQPGRRAEP